MQAASPSQDDILNLGRRFEEIDQVCFEEMKRYLKDTHKSSTNPLCSEEEATSLQGKLFSRSLRDMSQYFQDFSFLRYWRALFNIISTELAGGSFYSMSNGRSTSVKILEGLADGLSQSLQKVLGENRLTADQVIGIKLRIQSLEAFFEGIGTLIAARDLGSRSTSSQHLPPVELVRRRLPQITNQSDTGSQLNPEEPVTRSNHIATPRSRWRIFLTRNETMIAVTCVIPIISAVLQVYAFGQTVSNQKGSISDPEFLMTVQQFLMQVLSLFITLVPVFRSSSLEGQFGFWTWALSGISILLGILSVLIYPALGTAWSQLIAFLGVTAQAYVTLQLIEGLSKVEELLRRIKQHTA